MQEPLARFFAHDLAEIVNLRWRAAISRWGAGGDLPRPNGTGSLWLIREFEEADQAAKDASESRTLTWRHILQAYVSQALTETDDVRLQRALVRVAEEALSWAKAIDENEDDDDLDGRASQ